MKPFSTPVLSKRTYRELKLLKHIQHENVSSLSLKPPPLLSLPFPSLPFPSLFFATLHPGYYLHSSTIGCLAKNGACRPPFQHPLGHVSFVPAPCPSIRTSTWMQNRCSALDHQPLFVYFARSFQLYRPFATHIDPVIGPFILFADNSLPFSSLPF